MTLLEGNTPLIQADSLSRQLGGGFELFIKYEGLNPTGSFKDRGMTAAVSEARGTKCNHRHLRLDRQHRRIRRGLCPWGMKSIVLIPQGKVAAGKLAGAVAYGAQVIQIDGSFDDALTMVVEITNKHPICLVNSINPYRIEGQKSSAFEICDVLEGRAGLVMPAGGQRRKHHGLLGWIQTIRSIEVHRLAAGVGCSGRRRRAARVGTSC